MSGKDAAKLEELRFKSSVPLVSRTCTLQMNRAYQEECRNLKNTLESEGNYDTFKSKSRLFQENVRKEPLIFQHSNVKNSLLSVFKSTESALQ
jgi:hypothetical protein